MARQVGKLGDAEVHNFSASSNGSGHYPGPLLFPARYVGKLSGLLTDHEIPLGASEAEGQSPRRLAAVFMHGVWRAAQDRQRVVAPSAFGGLATRRLLV